jgi:Fe-S cluster assembly scaffold protein SufB
MALLETLDQIEQDDAAELAHVGVDVRGGNARSGTFIQRNLLPLCIYVYNEGLEMLPIAEALKKYDWLKDYYWKTVPPDLDEVTAKCMEQSEEPQGFFIRLKKGTKLKAPAQAGLYMSHGDVSQIIHNIVILEEDTELNLITGCLTKLNVKNGIHYAVSEYYLGKNAKLTNTMVHNWGPEVVVRPRSGTIIEEGGTFVSNYVSLRPAKSIDTNPQTWLNGKGASVKYLTVILGSEGATVDTGGSVYLNAEDTSAELAHRGVCTGGRMHQRGLLIGQARCRAHIDCAGMILDAREEGFIESTPGLKGLHPEARMSHEASIGKIAPEQVEYLMSRGMEEREAISMIIRGFLDADIEGLGPELDARIAEIAELAGHGEER